MADILNKPENILIVDDNPANLDILFDILKQKGYNIRPVTSGRQALETAKISPPDIILLDITMPEMDGYEVCQKIKSDEKLKKIPVIFISALNEVLDKVKAFSVGGVDYITKPFHYEEVFARVEAHLNIHKLQSRMEEIVQEKIKDLQESQMATIFALAKLSESRDDDTGSHLERVQTICHKIVLELSKKEKFKKIITDAYIDNIFYASPLHDIGKVGIHDNVLLKPGKLTPEEFDYMKTHAEMGAKTLEAVRSNYPKNAFINIGIDIARYHHEKWDGSGYNNGLKKQDIPLCARIMSVADVYDAMRSKRSYKAPISHKETLEELKRSKGTQFDPEIIDAFIEIEGVIEDVWDHFMQ